MRFSSTAAVVAAASPAVVSAMGTMGWAVGTKHPDGTCKNADDYVTDFQKIESVSGSKLVRGYSASDCNSVKGMVEAAKRTGFQVLPGIWIPGALEKDLNAIKSVYGQYKDQIFAVTVGSETLYRKDFTGDELVDQINTVKSALPGVQVGTADSWNKFADGTADPVIPAVDILLVNAFGFWQGQAINNASAQFFDDIMQAFGHIQEVSGSTDSPALWVGETGWPSDGGTDYGAAKAGTENAKQYFDVGLCGMLKWGVNTFYFEAFDEPWKPDSIGDDGSAADETHWGAMTAERVPKFALKC